MDYLVSAIQKLSLKERAFLLKTIKSQPMKIKLYQSILENPSINNAELNEKLLYKDKFINLYTLKNRLLDDIIECKLTIEKNSVITTRERIQNLRMLVYLKDNTVLIRELNKLQKSCMAYELFPELSEIYFCFFLTYRHDRKKADYYDLLLQKSDINKKAFAELEKIFYTYMLDSQDLFYFSNYKAYKQGKEWQVSIDQLHELLDCKTSDFIKLSSEITLHLNFMNDTLDDEVLLTKLNQLWEIYQNPFMTYKYPNCTLAIQCLYAKFYFLAGDKTNLEKSLKTVMDNLYRVKDNVMFEDCYFFTIYLSGIGYLNEKRTSRFVILVEDMLGSQTAIEEKDDKMKCYYYYLWCLKEYYSENLTTKLLYNSRNYYNSLDERSFWVICENVLLCIIIHLHNLDFDLIDSEINYLKRQLKKFEMGEDFGDMFKALFKGLREYEKSKNDVFLRKIFTEFKSSHDLLRLLDIDFVFNLKLRSSLN